MNGLIEFVEAEEKDLGALLDIYNYYLENTTTTFDLGKITLEEFKTRIYINNSRYKTFLACMNNELIGFCFLTQFREKAAYNNTGEVGLYLKPQFTGKGLGAKMVEHIEKIAKENQFEILVASISGENIPSIKLFEKSGYVQCANYKGIAVKFGRKMDLVDFQKAVL